MGENQIFLTIRSAIRAANVTKAAETTADASSEVERRPLILR